VWTNFIAVFLSLSLCLVLNRRLPDSLNLKKLTKREKSQKNREKSASEKSIRTDSTEVIF
jgi:hypothetical protein